MQNKYDFKKSAEHPNWWVLTDTENGLVCRFKEGEFNQTQKYTFLDEVENPDANKIASIANKMAEWIYEHHYNIIYSSPQEVKESFRLRIGYLITEERINKGWSREDLAKFSGISANHIKRIEEGKYNATLDTLALLCNAMGVMVDLV